MKKIIFYTIYIFSFLFISLQTVNAVTCWPNWTGTRTVESNCTYPGSYKVDRNIVVGNKTVTLPTGRTIGIDLVNRKITFTTGKINLSGTAKINNSVSTRYYRSYRFNKNRVSCPSGTEALNTSRTYLQRLGYVSVNSSGTMYCGKINSLGRNCQEVRNKGYTADGWYWINPRGDSIKMRVYCDMIGGAGRTRYLKIKGNYSFQDAKDCWNGSKYNSALECFNPNKFNMTLSSGIMAKRGGGIYYFTPLVKSPSISRLTSSGSYYCRGGSDYMVAMRSGRYSNTTASNAGWIWLGLNYCRYGRELGGRGSTAFMNYSSNSTMGPAPGARETFNRATEIYIR